MKKVTSFQLLQLCAFFVLAGRAYQFYFFGAPFRAVLWDESLLSPIVEGVFNIPWYEYAVSETVNYRIEYFTKFAAIILFTGAVVSLFWQRIRAVRIKKISIGASIFILVLLGICLVKSKNYDPLQFFELSIQFTAPLVLLFSKDAGFINNPRVLFWLKTGIVLTFIPHGLFATGIIYVPGHFIDMTIKILSVSETWARQFLLMAGLLDVMASVFLFLPKLVRYAYLYIIIWGFLTALARLVSGFNAGFIASSFHNFSYLTLYRLPHGLLPLAAFMIYNNHSKYINTIKTLQT